MSSTSAEPGLADRLASQRNATIAAGILVGVPAAYAFQVLFGEQGSFLLLVTLAVGVPTAYDEYWPRYGRTTRAVGWILLACAVAVAEFTGLYVAGVEFVGLPSLHASAGAFLVTTLGNAAWLSARDR